MSEELTTALAVQDENEDRALVRVIQLPGLEMTDAQVLRSVKDVFKGFDWSANENIASRFQDVAALAQFAEASMTDISEAKTRVDKAEMLMGGAALARFWYMGDVISRALDQANFGTGAASRLAAAMGKSVPNIYQIKAVAERLTPVQCYLLGVRGCYSTDLRKLAQVKDDTVREGIVSAFVSGLKDNGDKQRLAEMRRQLIAACNQNQNIDSAELVTSDPDSDGLEPQVSEEYQAVLRSINAWMKATAKLTADKLIEDLVAACSDFYMPTDAVNAETRLQDIKDLAQDLRGEILKAVANCRDAVEQLESLQAVEINSDAAAIDE